MRIVAIIPTVNKKRAGELIDTIRGNTVLPEKIIVIDNSGHPGPQKFRSGALNVEVIRNETNIGVNASWNQGIELAGDCDLVSILNDDILVRREFFERNVTVMKVVPACGVSCPRTTANIHRFDRDPGLMVDIMLITKREGWAWTIRKELLDAIPPIPYEEFPIFCGDDWYWYWTLEKGYQWYRDYNNVVYHRAGSTVNLLGYRRHQRRDRNAFGKAIAKYNLRVLQMKTEMRGK